MVSALQAPEPESTDHPEQLSFMMPTSDQVPSEVSEFLRLLGRILRRRTVDKELAEASDDSRKPMPGVAPIECPNNEDRLAEEEQI